MAYRILVALDGFTPSEAVLADIELIARSGAAVHLLRVVPPGVNATSAELRAGHAHALSYLAGLRERFPEMRGLDFIRTGDPADAVIQAAQEFDIHLIALATCLCAVPSEGFLGARHRPSCEGRLSQCSSEAPPPFRPAIRFLESWSPWMVPTMRSRFSRPSRNWRSGS